ncbi:hypothetical protein [uncultured Muribaculum sp.]|uniref:hypothetical protein n=1 Tax=uncultured Muribaculum sp. TaxID=1918613 RepID=UPI000EA10ACD|nr:hypothetical protein [uncultured Muribaculum sp.]
MAMWTNFYYGVVALALVFQVILLFWGKPIRKQIKLQGNYSPLGIVCNTVTAATILVVFGGVFTSQSALFVFLLFTIFLGKWMGWRVLTRKIITVSLLAFVLINKFQLHINFYQQFYNLFTQW